MASFLLLVACLLLQLQDQLLQLLCKWKRLGDGSLLIVAILSPPQLQEQEIHLTIPSFFSPFTGFSALDWGCFLLHSMAGMRGSPVETTCTVSVFKLQALVVHPKALHPTTYRLHSEPSTLKSFLRQPSFYRFCHALHMLPLATWELSHTSFIIEDISLELNGSW